MSTVGARIDGKGRIFDYREAAWVDWANQMFSSQPVVLFAHRLNAELLLDVSAFTYYDLRRYELDSWANSCQARPRRKSWRVPASLTTRPTLVRRLMHLAGVGLPGTGFKKPRLPMIRVF